MEQRANVIMLKCHGEERLKKAMAQGLIAQDIMDDVQEVLNENDILKSDLSFLSDEKKRMAFKLKNYEHIFTEALKAQNRENKRKERMETFAAYGKLFGIVIGLVFVTTMLMSMFI